MKKWEMDNTGRGRGQTQSRKGGAPAESIYKVRRGKIKKGRGERPFYERRSGEENAGICVEERIS